MKKFIKENWLKIVVVVVVIILISLTLSSKFSVQTKSEPQAKIDPRVACESALAYTTFSSGEEADVFVRDCIDGKHPEVIERYIQDMGTRIANPASLNCINNGGKLAIVDKQEGQVGMCTLSDGTVCEEWAYFRKECPIN